MPLISIYFYIVSASGTDRERLRVKEERKEIEREKHNKKILKGKG